MILFTFIIKERYGKKSTLLFTDTNSLTYQINQIKAYYLYEDFSRNKNMVGFSEYPENSKLFNTANKQ